MSIYEKSLNWYFPEDIQIHYEWYERSFSVNITNGIENQSIQLSYYNKLG